MELFVGCNASELHYWPVEEHANLVDSTSMAKWFIAEIVSDDMITGCYKTYYLYLDLNFVNLISMEFVTLIYFRANYTFTWKLHDTNNLWWWYWLVHISSNAATHIGSKMIPH